MSGRYFLKTYGCQMNEYDSARMADVLQATGGFVATDDPAHADLLLMNTCSVREKAEDKVYSLLGEWRLLKQQRPEVLIGVAGCVASQEGEAIVARAPFVDLVFGPQTLHRLPAMIAAVTRNGRPGGRPLRVVGAVCGPWLLAGGPALPTGALQHLLVLLLAHALAALLDQ